MQKAEGRVRGESVCYFPFHLYGFYYQQWRREENSPECTTIESYIPFTGDCKLFADRVEGLLSRHFEEFQRLEPSAAGQKVGKIKIGTSTYENIDLWHVVLSTYDTGAI